ncbi:MAG: LysR substrate-binding domain-containing protein, partial [Janthinobacterium sp.]
RLADSDSALQMVRDGSVFGCVSAEPGTAIDAAAATSVTPLGTMRYVCVATPVFAGHWFGDGFSPEAVQLAPAVVGQHGLLARFLAEQLSMREPFPHHTLPVEAARRACVLDGLAYGLMPQRLAAQALATDRLVDLLPGSTLDVPLSWHAWTLDTPFTKLLSEQIVKAGRDYLA